MSELLLNLSFLSERPTGLSVYAKRILPSLSGLNPVLLTSGAVLPEGGCIPPKLSSDDGSKGHARRLWWTQWQLPRMYRCLQANLLFSPIPEAPLFSQCRFVVTAHDFIPLRFPKRRSPLTPYFRYYVPEVIRQAQHVICNSEATARDVVQFAGVSAKHLTAIPLAYDANLFYSQDVPTDNYFLYVGRSDPHKNVHRLITAFAALPSSVDCELWIAGSSDRRYTPALQAQATELGVAHRVKWLDYITDEELVMLLNRAIALVFPSLWEGFGLPVLEAMACGTPVITSNLSSLPEVTGDAALLVDPYDSGAIAHAMQEVVTDNSVRSHLRQAGLRRAQAFSWEKTGQATVDVLTRYGAGVV